MAIENRKANPPHCEALQVLVAHATGANQLPSKQLQRGPHARFSHQSTPLGSLGALLPLVRVLQLIHYQHDGRSIARIERSRRSCSAITQECVHILSKRVEGHGHDEPRRRTTCLQGMLRCHGLSLCHLRLGRPQHRACHSRRRG